jgi:hypothetical protein
MTYSIFTIKMCEEYKDFARTLFAVFVIFLMLHVLLSGQSSTGLIGNAFNSPFSETLAKIFVSISFYYLVALKIISIS